MTEIKLWRAPRTLAAFLITLYQTYISPYKGFCCAYAMLYKELSCSAFGKAVIEQKGILRGIVLLWKRLQDCRNAALLLSIQAPLLVIQDDGCKSCGQATGLGGGQCCSGCLEGGAAGCGS
jgi:putative component of membrane protein insertase Oxa1/YidC/SpoIIIJ protein YidD